MWYKNIAGRFFGLITKHACDRRTDGQNYDSQDRASIAMLRRAVKTVSDGREGERVNAIACSERPSDIVAAHNEIAYCGSRGMKFRETNSR